MITLINWRPVPLSIIFRSSHSLISLLKNPIKALAKEKVVKKASLRKVHKDDDEFSGMFPNCKTNINTNMARTLYLVNDETAEKIAQHLIRLPDPDIPLVEINPGTGILTRLLLQGGMKDLRLFESKQEFVWHLEETYSNVHPDRVKVKHADLFSLHRIYYIDSLTGKKTADEILSGLPVTEWQNDINFRLFGGTGSMSFFKQLSSSIVLQNGLLALGRCEMYMVVPSKMYLTLTSSPKSGYAIYRTISILFQIFFEYELLDKYPRSHFLPYIANSKYNSTDKQVNKVIRRRVQASTVDPELMYFMKIVPRRDLYQRYPPNQIQELWQFIQRSCHSRNTLILLLLEKLIPDCGIRLLLQLSIQKRKPPQPTNKVNLCEIPPTTNPSMTLSHQDYYKDFNILTQFGELQPTEIFTLFHEFRSLPEYSNCNFLPSLDSALLKMGPKADDDETLGTDPNDDDVNNVDDQLEEKECNKKNKK